MNTMEDKIYGSDLEDRLLELAHGETGLDKAYAEGYGSQKDYEESTK